jgi:toxin CcdB
MARYDLYRASTDGRAIYLLDVQSNLLDVTSTRVVVPLFRRADYQKPAATLHPIFAIGGGQFVMVTHLIATLSTAELGRPVGDLAHAHFEILDALDKLFGGF